MADGSWEMADGGAWGTCDTWIKTGNIGHLCLPIDSTTALIPAFSPRRRRIARRLLEDSCGWFAGRTFAKTRLTNDDFLSWGRG